MPTVAFETLQEKKKKRKSKTFKRIKNLSNLSLFLRKRDTVLEALTRCVSILPGKKNNKVILFYSLQTVSPYSYLALVDRKLRFWQQVLPDYQDAGPFSGSEAHSSKLHSPFILGILFQPTHRPWHLPSAGQSKLCSQTQSQRTWQLYCSCCEFWQGGR